MAASTLAGQSGRRREVSGLGWSLVGHGLLLLLILFGGIVLPHRHEPTNLGIKATLVEQKAPARKPRADPAAAAAARAEEQQRVEAEKAEQLEQKRLADQKLAKQKKTEADAQARREAAEAASQAEVEKKAAEKRQAEARKAEAARKKAEEAKAEAAKRAEAKKKAEEKRLAEEKKAEAERKAAEAKAAAAKRAEEERRKAAQAEIGQALEEEERLLAAADSGALSEYVGLIRQKVTRNWTRPASARAGLACEVMVTQIPGGQVTGVQIGSCNGDEAVRRSIEAAVLRASPLPMPDDAALFERNLRFTFKPEQ